MQPAGSWTYDAAMTVTGPCEDVRKPSLPYTVSIRYGRTNSLVQVHRFPTRTMAEEAAAQIRAVKISTRGRSASTAARSRAV